MKIDQPSNSRMQQSAGLEVMKERFAVIINARAAADAHCYIIRGGDIRARKDQSVGRRGASLTSGRWSRSDCGFERGL